jgi:cob(I)alamin adenosyltransferase
MDEVHIVLYYKLLDVHELIEIMKSKPDHVELILTGRYAPKEIIDKADLVTEMKDIKHYYQKGVQARNGINF